MCRHQAGVKARSPAGNKNRQYNKSMEMLSHVRNKENISFARTIFSVNDINDTLNLKGNASIIINKVIKEVISEVIG